MEATNLDSAYEAAVITHGYEAAAAAAEASVEAFNTAAVAGLAEEGCKLEQMEAFWAQLGR